MKKQLNSFAILSVFFLLINTGVKAQAPSFTIGNDTTICSIPLTLHASGSTGSGPSPIFVPCSAFGFSCDDNYSQVIPIGFTFNYYGIPHTQCVLGTNGLINFDVSVAGGYCQWPISNAIPSTSNPANCIMFPWQDIYYFTSGLFSYGTFGTAPNRIFVFDFCQASMFSCTSLTTSQQVVLHETTNVIDIYLTNKPLCSNWNSGAAIEGVQDPTGLFADWVPGRNYPTQWTATNDGYEFTPSGPTTYTVASVPFAPVPMNAIGGITWYQNGGVVGTDDSLVINPSPNTTTQYIAIANLCGGSASDTINVTYDPMTLTTSTIDPTCANAANGSITATASGAGPYTYVWKDSLGNVLQTDANINGSSTLSNLYMGPYVVIATGALGCNLQHNDTLSAAFFQADFTFSPTGYCEDAPMQFTDASIGVAPIQWNWSFGDLGTSTSILQNPVYYYSDSGLYTASLIITVPGGCMDTVTHQIQAWPDNSAAFVYTPNIACIHRNINFTDQSTYYPVAWNWLTSDFDSASTSSFSHTFDTAGTYTIRLIEMDSLCGADTITQFINVFDYPITDIGKDTAICLGSIIQLDAGVPGMKYEWTTGQTTQTISVSPKKQTKYGVTIDNHGCIFTDDIVVKIECELYLPNAFSPNRDGYNDIFVPFGSKVTSYQMRIYSRWGELVYECTGGSDLKKGWDGMYKEELASMGVYAYVVKATFVNNETKEYKGNVTLLR